MATLGKITGRTFVFLIFSFAIFLLLPFGHASALTCAVRNGACNVGESPLLKMSGTDNAHAGYFGSSSYSNIICCKQAGAVLSASCSGTRYSNYDIFLNLSDTDNAHVEENWHSNYSWPACLHSDIGGIVCAYGGATCPGASTCLAKISGDTNAHIGDCSSSYATSVCCNYVSPSTLIVVASPASVTSGVATSVQFTVTSSAVAVSGATVTLTGGAGGTCTTNASGQCSISINAVIPVTATASKSGYTDGTTVIPIVAPNTLTVVPSLSSIDSGVPTTIVFTVTSAGSPISGATVTLTGGYSSSCTTNASGQCTIASISATTTINITATKATYIDGTANVTINALSNLTILSNPTSVTSGVTTSVLFSVSSIGPVSGATVTLTGGAGGTCTTDPSGQCIITVTATSTVTATASKPAYTDGTTNVVITAALCTIVPNSCDDGNPCTTDTCNPAVGCSSVNNTNPCNDGNPCTSNDTCGGGSCSGTPYTCTPTECQATSTCDGSGGCNITNKAAGAGCSSDGNQCTDDICDGSGTCTHPNTAAGTVCNDGKACTSPDACNGSGACVGPVNCYTPPNFQCYDSTGFCDASWNCAYNTLPNDTPCSIGNPCILAFCQSGVCTGGGNRCGGLVPCARSVDDPSTPGIDESKPCNVCAMFYMLKSIINYLMTLGLSIGLFIMILAGLLYALSAGNARRINMAKSAMSTVIASIIIIFIAWLAIAALLQLIGYANVGVWNQVNCNV